MITRLSVILLLFCAFTANAQGPYDPPAGQPGSLAIHKDSSAFIAWASACELSISWQNISDTTLGLVNVGNDTSATGAPGVNGIVSLGDGGEAILTFDVFIADGPGADFAIFENSFSDSFLELAFVEVSSDGVNYHRFDAVSLTDTSTQVGSFGNVDATNLNNLAGKYRAQYGTPFDLNELSGTPGLNLQQITHIKLIDAVGSINPMYATYDVQGRAVNDPWPTPFGSSGFDLDAIGVINVGSLSVEEYNLDHVVVYPNPVVNQVYLDFKGNQKNIQYQIVNVNGSIVKHGTLNEMRNMLDVQDLIQGIYIIQLNDGEEYSYRKIIKN